MNTPHASQPFAPHIEFLFGRVSDAEVAQCAGCSIEQVIERRQYLGLPAAEAPSQSVSRPDPRAPGRARDAQGGASTAPGAEVPPPPVVEPQAAESGRWSKDDIAMLGKVVDVVLARKLGITKAAVALKRKTLNISPVTRGPKAALPPQVEEKLGTMTDAALASISGLSHAKIFNRRTFLGIPAYGRPPMA